MDLRTVAKFLELFRTDSVDLKGWHYYYDRHDF